MPAKLTFMPLGNADTLFIELADGQHILIDYAHMNNGESGDKRENLPVTLNRLLGRSNHFKVVCITHTDADHCKGFGDFFWLDHAKKYQEEGRVKIETLWVPAAAILESKLDGDARIVSEEAKHRLRQGKGVKVFSQPQRLKEWMERNSIDFESRKNLIVQAGTLIPGFSKSGSEQVEFFAHCPFGWRQDENTVINRNEDSIVLHATFVEGGRESRLFLASDIDHETLSQIVETSRNHGNEHRLQWDIMKLPHHCSYRSLSDNQGVDKTKPDPLVEYLFEKLRETKAVIVSSSKPIPKKGTLEDRDNQPPHRQAAAYYEEITEKYGGQFKVTMEYPKVADPKPLSYNITAQGVAIAIAAATTGGSAAASTPRAGHDDED